MTIVRSSLIACALAVGAFASTTSAVAQSEVATVNIPFAFHIDQQVLPAGLYHIDHESSSLFRLRGPARSGEVLTHPMAARQLATQGAVVFHRIGGTYFLGGLWSPGAKDGMECFQTRAEKEMLKESHQQVPSLTTVAFNATPTR
jgi:hypothetical protein